MELLKSYWSWFLDALERVQNRAIRCIYHLPWESPSDQLFSISGVLPLKQRFTQLGSRYLAKGLYFKNKFILPMVSDYIRSYSTITSKKKLKTPFCWFLTMIAISIFWNYLNIYCITFLIIFLEARFTYFLFGNSKEKIFKKIIKLFRLYWNFIFDYYYCFFSFTWSKECKLDAFLNKKKSIVLKFQ